MDAERHPGANASQRARRKRLIRIDYHPSDLALELIKQRMGPRYPLNIYSGALDAIVEEWAELTGVREATPGAPMSTGVAPEFLGANARANDFGVVAPEFLQPVKEKEGAAQCGARTRAGRSCRAKGLPGTGRCKWHGGCSTGPKTAEGKARALANLRQFRPQ